MPVLQPALDPWLGDPLLLPPRVLPVLGEGFGERSRLPGAKGVVERNQFGQHDPVDADAVEDDVVQGQVEPVVGGRESDQAGAQQRTSPHVVGDPGHFGDQVNDVALGLFVGQMAEIEHREVEIRRRLHHLDGLTPDDVEGRPPGLVAANDLVEGAPEAPEIERSVLANRDRFVVADLVRAEEGLIPQGLLGNGQGRRPWAGDLGVCHAAKTCSSVSPRRPRLGRHRMDSSGARAKLGNLASRASNANWPSRRASGAPKQKWPAHPKAR